MARKPPEVHGRLAVVRWQRRLGHVSDHFTWLAGSFAPDDLPLIALSTAIAPERFQLLLEETPAGTIAQLDAPRHSWARTVDLPTVAWPDLAPLAETLRESEPDADWVARPDASGICFTCLLGSRAPSQLAPDELVRRILPAL